MSPKISVLIPLYNDEKFISRCLDSILNQTFQDFEIVVVDDASTDKSLKIVKDYQFKDKRIRIINKKINEGLMMARKTGYENAKGEYYLFCDSDDYLPPNSLSNLYSHSGPYIDMIVGDILVQYETGKTKIIKRSDYANNPSQYKVAILAKTTCTVWGILYHSRLFKNFKYTTFINQNFSEDRILLSQILENTYSIVPVPEITYIYNLNSSSITMQRLSDEVLESQIKAMKWCYEWNNQISMLEIYNNKWFIRTLFLYQIKGYNVFAMLKKTDLSYVFSFKNIKRYCGFIFALTMYLCRYSYLIRNLVLIMNKIREFIITLIFQKRF